MMGWMLGTDFILNSLEKEGIDHLFMIPGGIIDPFLQALSTHKNLKSVVAAQEGGAAYMADGYARASKKFGAVLCIGGPRLTDTVTAVATALTDGSPVLVLSGEASTEMEGSGLFQDAGSRTLDAATLKALTNYSSSIHNPKNLPHLFRKAMLRLRSIPAEPVHLSIPKDSQLACINASCVVGDVSVYLNWLLENSLTLRSTLDSTREYRKKWISEVKAGSRFQDAENCESSAVPIHPARVASELRKVLPRDGIVVIDSGAHRAFSGHYRESYEPLTYISATNLGPIGWAIPAANGIQCALPNKKVAVITGDGCMHMHGLVIATAARYRLPIVYVVINNAALGNVWLRAHKSGPIPDALTSLPDIDWAGFSRSLGGHGITVSNPKDLTQAFDAAFKNSLPTVIDVKTDKKFPTPVKEWTEACAAWSYHE